VALREYLVFDEEVRDILIKTEIEFLAAKTRELLKERGQPIIMDAKRKLDEGKISRRDYEVLEKRATLLDKDAGISK
jgi:defect in organelle trafficking protein DotB